MSRLLESLFPIVVKCSLIMLGISEHSITILLRSLKSFSADMTLNFFSVDVKVYWFLDRFFSCWPYYFRKTYHNTSFCLSVSVYKFYLYSPSSISTSKISHVTEDGDWSGVCLSRLLCQHNFEHNMATENEHNFKLFSKKSTAGIICFFNSTMWTIFVISYRIYFSWLNYVSRMFVSNN